MMVEKRPHPDDDNGFQNGSKRPRSNNASPAAATNGSAMNKPDMAKVIAEARARAEAAKARLTAPSQAPTQSPAEAARARIEAMKARVAAATAKAGVPSQQRASVPAPMYQPQELDDGLSRARGGLGIGLHPALMGDVGQDARSKGKQAMAPKFATTMANRRTESPVHRGGREKKELDLSGPNIEEIKKNPYFDASLGGQTATGRNRISRKLMMNEKGKYIAQAAALRKVAALERMKRELAEKARKANLDEDNEKAFIVEQPPDVEWWDEMLIDGKDYNVLSSPDKVKIDTEDSIVTMYIQHPVLIQPPQEKLVPTPKPMYLTKTEMAKLRRQRRAADHKEVQAKIRLGLEPPPPPKVKKSNLMRVLGEQAVKDPTAVEALVNRQIAERAAAHEQANNERMLTKEQRHEKLVAQQQADAARGIHMCVFKIDSLAYGKHRYQVDVNAKQNVLTGITILHPKMNLVIVEGGEHSIKNYKKLMLNRIKWSENAMPNSVREGNKEAEAAWLQSVDENGQLKDMSFNKCMLIWEGEERGRAFRKWGSRVCENDTEAKEALTRAKMESFWALAKSLP